MTAVAFYMHDLSGGGVERMRLTLIAELRTRGLAVTLILGTTEGPLAALLPQGLDVVTLGRRGMLGAVWPLARALRRLRPDILVSSLDHNNITAMLAGRIANAGTRVVICQHNALSAERAIGWKYCMVPWLYWLLQHCTAGIVAVSIGVADDMARVAGIPRRRITPIYNPVIDEGFAGRMIAAAPHPWLDDGGPPVLVFAGRLTSQKDPALLIEAFAKVVQAQPARLLILGEGPLQAALEDQVGRLGVSAQVAFAGFQPNPLPWIARAACLVSSSLYEGLGNVLIEALACGTPVIATNCPHGPAEILGDGAFGTLVPVGDAGALAAAISGALAGTVDRAALRARGAAFSAAACADSHLALFTAITAPRRISALGLKLSPLPAKAVVDRVISEIPAQLRLVVTPNIDHVRLLRRQAFAQAYQSADLVCPDGFPVLAYARLRGLKLTSRVTGCELFRRLAEHPQLREIRLTVVVEAATTEAALLAWARGRGLEDLHVLTAQDGLAQNPVAQSALARSIAATHPAVLVMTLGAPLSEVFVSSHRAVLPPCWALCVGQAVRVHLGLVQRAPAFWQRIGLEWAWRIRQEPRRLTGRYARALAWFPLAVIADCMRKRQRSF